MIDILSYYLVATVSFIAGAIVMCLLQIKRTK